VTTPALLVALLLAVGPGRQSRPAAAPPPAAPGAEATAPSEAAPAAALSDAEVKARVRAFLRTIDTPVRASQWRALGPRAVPHLTAAAGDPQLLPSRRAAALSALGVVGGPAAREAVLAALRDDAAPYAIRSSALRAAGALTGEAALVQALRPVLERDPEPALRATAAEVLATRAPRAGCAAVRAQAAREPADAQPGLATALGRCAAAVP
jgi:hypothetical protein